MEKVIGLLKDELAGKMTKEFHGLKANSYSYLIDDVSDDKKQEAQIAHKKWRAFEDFKNYLVANQLKNKINELEKMKLIYKILKAINSS